MRRDEASLVAATSVGHALCHVSTLVLQQVLEEAARDFGTPKSSLGWVVTIGQCLMGVGALPAGFLADRYGSRRTYFAYLFGLAIACAAAGLAPSLGTFVVAVAAVGAAASFHHPVALRWLAESIGAGRGVALGIHGFVGHGGSTLAPLFVLWMLAHVGWRAAYSTVAVAALGLALLLFLVPRTAAEGTPATSGGARRRTPWKLVLALPVVMVLLAVLPNGFVHQGFWTTWTSYVKGEAGALRGEEPAGALVSTADLLRDHLPRTLVTTRRPEESERAAVAGLLATAVLAFGSFGELAGGFLARRRRGFRLYALFTAVSAVGLIGLVVLRGVPALAAGALFAFFHFGGQPIENELLAERADPRVRGVVYGLKFVASFGIGSLAALVCGRAASTSVFAGLAVTALVGAAVCAWLARRERVAAPMGA